jgi:hypothetical protein
MFLKTNQLSAQEEKKIIAAARQDISEFAKLYEYYQNRIFRYIRFRGKHQRRSRGFNQPNFP